MTEMPFYRLGIVGYPLGHSLSPVLQGVFLEGTGLAGSYTPFEVPPEALGEWLSTQPHALGLQGFNLTIPHKVSVLPHLVGVDAAAQAIGAVNTVRVTPEGLFGENTDAPGFLAPLQANFPEGLTGQHVLMVGAGGASRAVAYALLKAGVSGLTVWVRSLERASASRDTMMGMAQSIPNGGKASINFTTTLSAELLAACHGVVNTSPVGMHPHHAESPLSREQLAVLPDTAWVYDLVYNPLETTLLRQAREQGLPYTQDGLDMLIHQGALAFASWTGILPAAGVIKAARTALLSRLGLSL